MATTQLYEIWESANKYEILEDNENIVDNNHIIGRVVGPAFFPDTVSRNKVFYPKNAWVNAISEKRFNDKLSDRLVLGTIGHSPDLNDDDIREGKCSHIVNRVWIDENDNIGKAEYLILNTPSGNTLNTLLRAGVKLRVSTKANGLFESSIRSDGSKSVDEDNFKLDRIDFVIDPGYLAATPKLLESYLNLKSNEEVNIMTDKVVEILEARIKELKDEKNMTEENRTKLNNDFMKIMEERSSMISMLESYKMFGTVHSIQESFAELEQYRQIGPSQEIHEALDEGVKVVEELADTVQSLSARVEDLENELNAKSDPNTSVMVDDEDLGTPSDIKDALDMSLDMKNELEKYRELGTVEELKELVNRADELTEELLANKVSEVATKYNCDPSVIKKMLDKDMTLEEVEDILGEIKKTSSTEENGTDKPNSTTESPDGEEDEEKEDESGEVSEQLSTKLFRMSRYNKNTTIAESANSYKGNSSLAAKLLTVRK